MRHLPVFAIIGRAIWFVIANLFTLFRLTWLPLALLIAAQHGLAHALVLASPGVPFEVLKETSGFATVVFTAMVLQGLALSVVAVRVHRVILFDDRRRGEYFAFPFGWTEILYVLMGAITFTITITAFLVAFLGISYLFGAMDTGTLSMWKPDRSTDPSFIGPQAFIVIATAFVVWVTLRLTVWPPTVVATGRFSLGEALRLSWGNAWALFALLFFSTAVVFVVVMVAAFFSYYAKDVSFVLALAPTPEDLKVKNALMGPPKPTALLGEFTGNFLLTTYTVAILSYAYKALKGYELDLPIDQQQEKVVDEIPGSMKPMGAL